MANREDRFFSIHEMFSDFENTRVESQIFRCSSTWQDNAVIVLWLDIAEGIIESEVVSRLFSVSLVTFEVMNRGFDFVSSFFFWAHNMNSVA
jgi:hypothetical protein